jgi:hypothetical protein
VNKELEGVRHVSRLDRALLEVSLTAETISSRGLLPDRQNFGKTLLLAAVCSGAPDVELATYMD